VFRSPFVGINENSLDRSIVVYPNPTQGNVTVTSSGSKIENLEIRNLLGALVYSHRNDKQENSIHIELTDYPKGIYFMNIETAGGMVIRKITKD